MCIDVECVPAGVRRSRLGSFGGRPESPGEATASPLSGWLPPWLGHPDCSPDQTPQIAASLSTPPC